eukprot:158640-Pyramimonas_sp.AAC.1
MEHFRHRNHRGRDLRDRTDVRPACTRRDLAERAHHSGKAIDIDREDQGGHPFRFVLGSVVS